MFIKYLTRYVFFLIVGIMLIACGNNTAAVPSTNFASSSSNNSSGSSTTANIKNTNNESNSNSSNSSAELEHLKY